jgi:branched-chain amino acid transport system permease protein
MIGQLIISGTAQGAIYALVALGMTILYRATTIMNFAHGEFFMAGAFAVYVCSALLGIGPLEAAAVAIAFLFCLGMAIDRGLMRWIKQEAHLSLVMMTIGVSYLLRGIARAFWGGDVLQLAPVFSPAPFKVGPAFMTYQDVLVVSVALVLVISFFLLFRWSRLGKTLQAIAETPRGAGLVGINVPRFNTLMWGVTAGIGALSGVVVAPVTLLYPDMGAAILIRGVAAMTLGGFGSFVGAIVGGLAVGFTEAFTGAYVSSALIDISALLVIVLVLLIRPEGLFGKRDDVRV